jgi:hypothetical protein
MSLAPNIALISASAAPSFSTGSNELLSDPARMTSLSAAERNSWFELRSKIPRSFLSAEVAGDAGVAGQVPRSFSIGSFLAAPRRRVRFFILALLTFVRIICGGPELVGACRSGGLRRGRSKFAQIKHDRAE